MDVGFLSALNPQQRTAAEHTSGPLLVVAGAGTGKTKTLASRVAALIQGGADSSRILLLTFTRRAAAEMIRRAGQVVGETVAAGIWAGTFHGVAHRLLRAHARQLGLDPRFVILDQGDAEDLFHLVRTDLELHKSVSRFPQKSTLLAIYSRCVNAGEPLDRVLATRFPWCEEHVDPIKQVFQGYTERKAQRGLLDYDDLLLCWDQALDMPGVAQALGRFRHVLVDEYQDTNPLQASILRKLWAQLTQSPRPAPGHCSIMVVGDDAQSIYSFRGATVENILEFPKQFPGTTVVTLEQNYRSVQPILDASNAVMGSARRRFTKNLWSERKSDQKPLLVTCADELEQARFVVDRILLHREEGIPLTKQAVLVRAGHNSDALEVELARRNVPFVKWGGLKFLEAAHVKDLLAFLRIAENPRDELSWMRVLQMIEGVGPGRARQAIEHLHQTNDAAAALASWKSPAAARKLIEGLVKLLEELTGPESALPVAGQIERIRRHYVPILMDRYEQPEVRVRDLDQLELLARQAPSRAVFLADLTLDPPASTQDLAGPPLLDEEYVVLSTIHSAKGCEWPVVYLIHAADGVIPSDMANSEEELEEERRLLYVAMTRPKDRLYVVFPLRYYHKKHRLGDAHSFAQVSRFLPPKLEGLFERNGAHPDQRLDEEAKGASEGQLVTTSVRDRLARLWK